MTTAAPAAASSAYIAGDPCLDRITASLPFRERYRHALGIGDRTLVVVSSTWSDQSALGSRFELLRELLAELPRDSYAVAAVLHPNIRHHHGPGLIAHWYADCLRSGLIMLDEIDGWRAGLIAADVLIGDHGAVTGYGAAIGRPTVLAAFTDTPPGTAISELGDAAPRLPAHGPYRPIVDAMRGAEFSAADRIAGLATSEPGRSLELLRKLFYDLLALPVPPLAAIAALIPQPETISPTGSFADDVLVTPIAGCAGVDIERRPAEMRRFTDTNSDSHVCCHADYPVRTLRSHARVLVADRMDAGPDALGWLRSLLQANPLCELVALLSDTHLMALHRDGRRFQVDCAGCPGNAAASALYAIICAGTTPAAIAVRLGRDRFRILIEADE
ncbi:hypothetical protein [Nocardia sp.]|uniref:hypothetical protein n=1 Tax=Nocardia sp. TaxID=1821 RepID=UPI002621E127|nr:hypothetical protein [Nocardia sp.]